MAFEKQGLLFRRWQKSITYNNRRINAISSYSPRLVQKTINACYGIKEAMQINPKFSEQSSTQQKISQIYTQAKNDEFFTVSQTKIRSGLKDEFERKSVHYTSDDLKHLTKALSKTQDSWTSFDSKIKSVVNEFAALTKEQKLVYARLSLENSAIAEWFVENPKETLAIFRQVTKISAEHCGMFFSAFEDNSKLFLSDMQKTVRLIEEVMKCANDASPHAFEWMRETKNAQIMKKYFDGKMKLSALTLKIMSSDIVSYEIGSVLEDKKIMMSEKKNYLKSLPATTLLALVFNAKSFMKETNKMIFERARSEMKDRKLDDVLTEYEMDRKENNGLILKMLAK